MASKRKRPLIAIVDDDVSICRAMKRFLWTYGIDAEAFTSGSVFIEVLEALPSFRPRCVVLDAHMPGMDGLQVQTRLRALRPEVPVLFVTAGHDGNFFKRALAMGAVAFFHKPFDRDLEVFVKTLRAVLNMEEDGKS
jgi:FixJ family two-component response regulator